MNLYGIENQAHAQTAHQAVGPTEVIIPERCHIILIGSAGKGLVQHTFDTGPVAAIQTHLEHEFEVLAQVEVAVGEDIGLRNTHHGLVRARFRRAVPGFFIGLELIALIVLLRTELQPQEGEEAEHGELPDNGEAVHRELDLPLGKPRRIPIPKLGRHSPVHPNHPIVIGLLDLQLEAVQILVGDRIRQAEELLVQIYLGKGEGAGRKKAHDDGNQALHRNISSMSICQIISARSSTLMRNWSFTLKKRTFSGCLCSSSTPVSTRLFRFRSSVIRMQ